MNDSDFERLNANARDALVRLNDTVRDAVDAGLGPHAFFHHVAHAIERVSDVGLILQRMIQERRELTELLSRELQHDPEFAARQEILNATHELSSHLKVDLESLYLFGQLLLEQWAHTAGRVGGIDLSNRRDGAFHALFRRLEAGSEPALASIWAQFKGELIWLFYELRFYRNRFIAHANRPWQRGSGYSHTGFDFRLHTPTPPGWLDIDIGTTVDAVWSTLPPDLTAMTDRHRPDASPALKLQVMRQQIGSVPKRETREAIADLFRDLGGETETFAVVGERILAFVASATDTLAVIAAANPEDVLIGTGAGVHRIRRFLDERKRDRKS